MIRIEVDDREVREALEDLRRRVQDMTPAMHAIGQALMEGSRERILEGKDWTGQPFAPNSPATLARKKGAKPLIDQKTFVTSRLHHEVEADSAIMDRSAALILAPQEVWCLKLSASEELYLLGRFMRGKQVMEAPAVFKRGDPLGDWREAKTAYLADADDYLNEKRRQIMKQRAAVRYLDVAGL